MVKSLNVKKTNKETLKICAVSIKTLKPNKSLCSLDFITKYFPDAAREIKSSNLLLNRVLATANNNSTNRIIMVRRSFEVIYRSIASNYKFLQMYNY